MSANSHRKEGPERSNTILNIVSRLICKYVNKVISMPEGQKQGRMTKEGALVHHWAMVMLRQRAWIRLKAESASAVGSSTGAVNPVLHERTLRRRVHLIRPGTRLPAGSNSRQPFNFLLAFHGK